MFLHEVSQLKVFYIKFQFSLNVGTAGQQRDDEPLTLFVKEKAKMSEEIRGRAVRGGDSDDNDLATNWAKFSETWRNSITKSNLDQNSNRFSFLEL